MKYIAVLSIWVWPEVGRCLDTTEAFELGFSDFEFYMGREALKDEKSPSIGETVIGIGLSKNFSVGFGFSDSTAPESKQNYGVQLFYSVIEKERFDLDLLASFEHEGDPVLGIETNLDHSRWGLQLSLESEISNQNEPGQADLPLTVTPLIYRNLGDRTQLLVALEWSGDGAHLNSNELGAAMLGVNFSIRDSFELITEIAYTPAVDASPPNWNASIGFIATIF